MVSSILFLLGFLGIFIILAFEKEHKIQTPNWLPLIYGGIIIFFAFTGIIFIFISGKHRKIINEYDEKIKLYPEYGNFNMALDYIEANDLNLALHYYRNTPKGQLRDYLLDIIIFASLKINDPVLVEEIKKKIQIIRETYDIDCIFENQILHKITF